MGSPVVTITPDSSPVTITPDAAAPPSTPLQTQMQQHFGARDAYDAYLHSGQPKMAARPMMREPGVVMPQDIPIGMAKDVATLTRAGYQSMVKGITGKPLIGEPPSTQQVLSSGKNIGLGMLLGGVEGEGVPPTQGLNRAVNQVPTSDAGFSLAGKLAREVPGIGGLLRKFDLVKSLTDNGQPAPNVPRGTLPPQAPEIVKQGWAMQQGGRPAAPAQTGEALATVRQNSSPVPQMIANNASGGNPASLEAASRVASNNMQGIGYRRITASGQEMPIANTVDAVDMKAQPGEQIIKRFADGHEEIQDTGRGFVDRRTPQSVGLKLPQAKGGDPYSGPRTPTAMEPAQSTTISQHGYHPDSQTMVVQFKNGNVYEYRGVPQEVYNAYKNSESQGSFFANNIKGRYTTNLRGTVGKSAGTKAREALGRKPSSGS